MEETDREDTEPSMVGYQLSIGDEVHSGEPDSCPWCEYDTTPEGEILKEKGYETWSSGTDDHWGNEYTFNCEMCAGAISLGAITVVTSISPPTEEKLAHTLAIIQENAEELANTFKSE